MTDTMRAVRFHEYGPAESLVVDEIQLPSPGDGEVLVRVRAAGVNPIDWKLRAGFLKDYMPLELPHTSGLDLAGIVEAVGRGVSGFATGQEVYGRGTGSYADYAIAPAATLALKPARISFEQAASIPVGATTAWSALFDVAGLAPGQTVLIHGAAGGVGLYAVQLAHWKGATVIATASGANGEFVRSLGADTVIDYTTTRFEDVAKNVDVVVDVIGGDVQERSWAVLAPGGMLVAVAGMASEDKAKQHNVRTAGPNGVPTAELLATFAELIDTGVIRTEVGRTFPLVEARQAQELSETGHGRGRIVLEVS